MIKTRFIFYSIAILTGIILYFLLKKKIIDKKILQTIMMTWICCTLFFNVSFLLIQIYVLEVSSFSVSYYLHYVQIIPLIIILTFYSLYWLKHFRGKEGKSTEKSEPNDTSIVFMAFAIGSALINLFLPPIQELWLKLVIMLGFGVIVGLIVGLILWRNRKQKEHND